LLLGVSGGIAAYKALETARLAVKAGHAVRVIQTPTSERFVGAASFQALTGAPVLTSEFEPDPARGSYPGEPPPARAPISHLALVARAELYLIAPASANTLAKLAHGHADNLLSSAALAAPCPVAVAPAMNNRMYAHPATQANLELLAARGVTVIRPDDGELASHDEYGIGRLSSPAALLAACESLLSADLAGAEGVAPRGPLSGVRVLVSAGGTREPIDSVRFIGNRSSGRMGFALATEAVRRGAEVTVVAANVGLDSPAGLSRLDVNTAAELEAVCARELEASDVVLMTAAVADFRPARPVEHKLKKDSGAPATLELEPTADILAGLTARRRPGQVIVGFAAEHGAGTLEHGRDKLARKALDAIVVNDISRPGVGFEAAENAVTILTADGVRRDVQRTSKRLIAHAVLDEVQRLRAIGESPTPTTNGPHGGAARAGARSAARV